MPSLYALPANHTPGPWEAQIEAAHAAIPGHVVHCGDAAQTPVAFVPRGSGITSLKTYRANAKLIAAAPDLYDLLSRFNHLYKADADLSILEKASKDADELLERIASAR